MNQKQRNRRDKRRRHQSAPAEFSVFCPGVLEVLSIGKGDLRLSIGESEDDKTRARELIEEMLRKGYSIFVETDDGPVRVQEFNPHRMTYLIVDAPAATDGEDVAATPTKRPAAKRKPRREVPVAGSRATAVGRTAGG